MKKAINKKRRDGFVIVIAVLTGGLLLSISLAILGIGVKELTLSAAGRDSQFAFFAADSGIDCALLWDRNYSDMGLNESPFENPNAYTNNQNITCNEKPITGWDGLAVGSVVPVVNGGVATTTHFSIPFGENCAKVDVIKTSSPYKTVIESRGQTKCLTPLSKDRLDRAIRASFGRIN